MRLKSLLTPLSLVLLAAPAMAQSSSTATANIGVRILRPLVITKTLDMEFGTIVTTDDGSGGTTVGTVVLAPDSSRSVTGGAVLLGTQGGPVAAAPQAATFTVKGSAGRGYNITLAANTVTLKHTSLATTLTVGTFRGSLNGGAAFALSTTAASKTLTGTFPGLTTDTLTVGGTLTLPATASTGLDDGDYTAAANSTSLSVTVAYN